MKKWLLCLFLLPSLCAAGSNTGTLATFMKSVRMECGIPNNSILPDSVLIDMSSRSIRLVSTEIGGVEARYTFQTVAFQAFYSIPDTTVEIIGASLISGTETHDFRAVYPQYFANEGDADAGDIVGLYAMFDDSVQVYPIPQQVDTVYLNTYVEHPELDSSVDTVCLKVDYQEAAKIKTLELIHRRLEEFEKADWYKATYKELKAELKAKHAPKYDVPRKPE